VHIIRGQKQLRKQPPEGRKALVEKIQTTKKIVITTQIAYLVFLTKLRPMIIERNKNELKIRIQTSRNSNRIQSIIDYLRYEELTADSNVNSKEADKVIASAKKGRWDKIRKELNSDQ
jgi:hypothetical protein